MGRHKGQTSPAIKAAIKAASNRPRFHSSFKSYEELLASGKDEGAIYSEAKARKEHAEATKSEYQADKARLESEHLHSILISVDEVRDATQSLIASIRDELGMVSQDIVMSLDIPADESESLRIAISDAINAALARAINE